MTTKVDHNDGQGQPISGFSRRQFLQRAAITAGAAAAVPLAGVAPVLARPYGQDAVSLRAMTIGNPERAALFEGVVGAFREAHPTWNLEWVPVAAAEWDAYLARVATILASGQQLDNVEVGTEGFLLFATSGIIRDLQEYVTNSPEEMQNFFSDVNPKLIEAVMYNGSIYNLPQLWAVAGMYYNRRLFDQAGLEYPAEDWTVEQFVEAARAIGGLGDDIYGYAFPNRHWGGFIPWTYIRDSNVLVREQYEGGEWLWDTFYPEMDEAERAERGGGYYYSASMANDPRNVEALQLLQDLAFVDETAYTAPVPDLQTGFSTNRIGMIPSHRGWISAFRNNGMSPEDYDVVYMPRWESQTGQFGGSGLAVTTLSPFPDQAWELLKYMTSAPAQSAFIQGGIHTASRRSVTNAQEQNEGVAPENWHVFYDQLDERDAYLIPAPPQNRDFTTIFTQYISLAMANEMTAQDALDNMHTDLNRMLGVS